MFIYYLEYSYVTSGTLKCIQYNKLPTSASRRYIIYTIVNCWNIVKAFCISGYMISASYQEINAKRFYLLQYSITLRTLLLSSTAYGGVNAKRFYLHNYSITLTTLLLSSTAYGWVNAKRFYLLHYSKAT